MCIRDSDKTLEYMRMTNRSEEQVKLVEDYCKANLLWRTGNESITYTHILELNLSTIEPTVSGPKRPQDKILLKNFPATFADVLHQSFGRKYIKPQEQLTRWFAEGGSSLPMKTETTMVPDTKIEGKIEDGMKIVTVTVGQEQFMLSDGAVVIAAITSCTNTSNPYVMIGAGLVARKAREHGLLSLIHI